MPDVEDLTKYLIVLIVALFLGSCATRLGWDVGHRLGSVPWEDPK